MLVTEERKKTCKESIWPADFAEDEEDDLGEDKKAVEDRPEGSCRGIGSGGTPVAQDELPIPVLSGRHALNIFATLLVRTSGVRTIRNMARTR